MARPSQARYKPTRHKQSSVDALSLATLVVAAGAAFLVVTKPYSSPPAQIDHAQQLEEDRRDQALLMQLRRESDLLEQKIQNRRLVQTPTPGRAQVANSKLALAPAPQGDNTASRAPASLSAGQAAISSQ